jgi:hypothetical protein
VAGLALRHCRNFGKVSAGALSKGRQLRRYHRALTLVEVPPLQVLDLNYCYAAIRSACRSWRRGLPIGRRPRARRISGAQRRSPAMTFASSRRRSPLGSHASEQSALTSSASFRDEGQQNHNNKGENDERVPANIIGSDAAIDVYDVA